MAARWQRLLMAPPATLSTVAASSIDSPPSHTNVTAARWSSFEGVEQLPEDHAGIGGGVLAAPSRWLDAGQHRGGRAGPGLTQPGDRFVAHDAP